MSDELLKLAIYLASLRMIAKRGTDYVLMVKDVYEMLEEIGIKSNEKITLILKGTNRGGDLPVLMKKLVTLRIDGPLEVNYY